MVPRRTLLQACYDPDAFFGREHRRLSVWHGALVVLAVAAVSAAALLLAGWLIARHATGTVVGEDVALRAVLWNALVPAVVLAFVGLLVSWPLLAAVFHGLSWVFENREGGYTDTLALTAWGHLPSVVPFLAVLVSAALTAGSVDYSGFPEVFGQQVVDVLTGGGTVVVVAVLALLWQGYVWTYAVKHARGVRTEQGAAVVAVVVALLLLGRVV